MTILRDILAEISNSPDPQNVLVVFDLDSTLYCVGPRTQQILRDYSQVEEHQKSFPKECSILKGIETTPIDWGIRQALERHQDLHNSPFEFYNSVRDYWIHHFFTSEHLLLDEPYKGAVEYVKAVQKTGAEIRYLTARDRQRMGDGTLASLKAEGFPYPDGERVQLFMKGDLDSSDSDYKVEEFKSWTHPWKYTWAKIYYFENEPVIINEVEKLFPQVQIVFVDSVHSSRATVRESMPAIGMDWSL